jgi:hypothetical protein
MMKGHYFKCFYCGILYSANEDREIDLAHSAEVCLMMETFREEIDRIECFSCGTREAALFSHSQIAKQRKMRCNICIEAKKSDRHRRNYFSFVGPARTLVDAVCNHDLEAFERFLQADVDVNAHRQLTIRDEVQGMWRFVYDEDGNPMPDNQEYQPTTPLKMVVFRISDCCLGPSEHDIYYTMAVRLIERGAARQSAWDYYVSRYGPYEESTQSNHNNNEEEEDIYLKLARLLVNR